MWNANVKAASLDPSGWQIEVCTPQGRHRLRFPSASRALLFLRYLAAELPGGRMSGGPDLERLVAQSEAEAPSPAPAGMTTPEHEAFIRQVGEVIWSAAPSGHKRTLLLALYRPLLPEPSLKAVAQLPPEMLIARLKMETTSADLCPPPYQTAL